VRVWVISSLQPNLTLTHPHPQDTDEDNQMDESQSILDRSTSFAVFRCNDS
jgi:hypothetical protein